MKIIKENINTLNEAFSESMPKWLKVSLSIDAGKDTGDLGKRGYNAEIQRRQSADKYKNANPEVLPPRFTGKQLRRYSLFALLNDLGIDLTKANFISSDVPKKFSDPRLQGPDGGYISFLYLKADVNGQTRTQVYSPGVNDSQDAILPDRKGELKTLRYVPRPEILSHAQAFCYLDMADKNNFFGDKLDNRKATKKDMDWSIERQARKPSWGEILDKSGYIVKPDKYKNKLAKMGLEGAGTQKKLDEIYNRLKGLYRDAINTLQDFDVISDASEIGNMVYSIQNRLGTLKNYYNQMLSAVDDYTNASDQYYKDKFAQRFRSYYNDAKEQLNRFENELGNYISQEIDWDSPE